MYPCVTGLNKRPFLLPDEEMGIFIGGRFLGRTGQKKTLKEYSKSRCAGSAYSEQLKNEHEKTLQALICKVFWWSIGESNP